MLHARDIATEEIEVGFIIFSDEDYDHDDSSPPIDEYDIMAVKKHFDERRPTRHVTHTN